MTIPIIPGPWSFLAEAGAAAGDIGTALEVKRERLRTEASQGFQNVLALVNSGRADPSVLGSEPVQHMLRMSGTPAMQLQPSAEDLTRNARRRLVAGAAPGSAQERAIAQVPSEPVAAAAETTATAGARSAVAGATTAEAQASAAPAYWESIAAESRGKMTTLPTQIQATLRQSEVTARIFDGAMRMLGNDDKIPGFNETSAQLAGMAAMGFLPAFIQQLRGGAEDRRMGISMGREFQTSEMQLLMGAMHEAGQNYRDVFNRWDAGLQQRITQATVNGTNVQDPAARREIISAYEQDAGPVPDQGKVMNEWLRDNFGMTTSQYQDRVRTLTHTMLGTTGGPTAGGPTAGGGAQPAQGDPAQQKMAGAVQLFRDSPTTQTVDNFITSYKAGRWSITEARAIRARIARLNVPPAVLQHFDSELAQPAAPQLSHGR